MKKPPLFLILLCSLCAALALPTLSFGQNAQAQVAPPHHHYKVVDLGTLGGPQSFFNEEGVPAYLEASTPRVVPFYSRHGYHELERFALKGGPDWSLMWRDPR